jgi:hypothetical protein
MYSLFIHHYINVVNVIIQSSETARSLEKHSGEPKATARPGHRGRRPS